MAHNLRRLPLQLKATAFPLARRPYLRMLRLSAGPGRCSCIHLFIAFSLQEHSASSHGLGSAPVGTFLCLRFHVAPGMSLGRSRPAERIFALKRPCGASNHGGSGKGRDEGSASSGCHLPIAPPPGTHPGFAQARAREKRVSLGNKILEGWGERLGAAAEPGKASSQPSTLVGGLPCTLPPVKMQMREA